MAANKQIDTSSKKSEVQAPGSVRSSALQSFANLMTIFLALLVAIYLVWQSDDFKSYIAAYFVQPKNELFQLSEFKEAENQLQEVTNTLNVQKNEIRFTISASSLFESAKVAPTAQYDLVMNEVVQAFSAMDNIDIFINVVQVPSKASDARKIAESRLAEITLKLDSLVESKNIDLYGKTTLEALTKTENTWDSDGWIQFRVQHKMNEAQRTRIGTSIGSPETE